MAAREAMAMASAVLNPTNIAADAICQVVALMRSDIQYVAKSIAVHVRRSTGTGSWSQDMVSISLRFEGLTRTFVGGNSCWRKTRRLLCEFPGM